MILAVPFGAVDDAVGKIGASIQGKTPVDVSNPLTEDMQLASGCTTSGAERLQQVARGAPVVKAFNTQFAGHTTAGGWHRTLDHICRERRPASEAAGATVR